jgi:predicted nucleic-acid-binding Zn-ribbon protein
MVEIVGVDNTKVLRVTCGNCASMLQYTRSETRRETYRDYTGGSDTYDILKCPKCGHEIKT